MDIFGSMVQGFTSLFGLAPFIALVAGTVVGVILGIIPGIGGIIGTALTLPFLFGVDPMLALPFMLALQSVTATGGSITAILVNIPGTEQNIATMTDGFPMSQKGEGDRAMGAALMASMTGGVVAVFAAVGFMPLVVPLVLQLHSPELFFLILLGVSFIAIVGTTGAKVKGIISGGLGLLTGLIGFQALTGEPRFTFGTVYLLDGLALVPVIMGLFAGAELIELAITRRSIAPPELVKTRDLARNLWKGSKDVFIHRWIWLRGSIIGFVFGALPGIGAPAAVWVAYGQAKKTSKNQEEFGTGRVEGVIAPEAANNAKEAGALLTTLAFGIPGTGLMAMNMAAWMILGLSVGPDMLTKHTTLSFAMVWTIAISNILGGAICYLMARPLVKLTVVHPDFLFPVILALIFVGAFATGETMGHLIVLLIFTVVGILMKRFNYSRPAFIIGFVLGMHFESYYWLSLKFQGPLFFLRPISLGIIAIMAAVFSYEPIRSAIIRPGKKGAIV